MGRSIDIFKVNANKLRSSMSESFNGNKYKVSFDKYIERTEPNLSPQVIIQKAKTDMTQLSEDEFWGIICWLNYAHKDPPLNGLDFEDATVKQLLDQFGFEMIADFDDRKYIFSFTTGDFKYDYFNDFNGTERQTACLRSDEFGLFIDYAICFYSMLFLRESSDDTNIEQWKDNIERSSGDAKLKAIVESNVSYVISDKHIESGYLVHHHLANGAIKPVLEPDYVVYDHFNNTQLQEFEYYLRLVEDLKKLVQDNTQHILILGS